RKSVAPRPPAARVSAASAARGIVTRSFGDMRSLHQAGPRSVGQDLRNARRLPLASAEPTAQPVEIEIDDGRRIERQPLRHEEPADDCDAERAAQFGSRAATD